MTELDIEKERREFAKAFCAKYGMQEITDDQWGVELIADMFEVWLAAKRAVLGSAEPVGEVAPLGRFTSNVDWFSGYMPPVGTKLYTAPPAPVSAEPVKMHREWKFALKTAIDVLENECEWREDEALSSKFRRVNSILTSMLNSAPPSTDAKDSERLDFLDGNLKWKMGWSVGIAPVGNVSIFSVGNSNVSIRAAIDAAIAAREAGK